VSEMNKQVRRDKLNSVRAQQIRSTAGAGLYTVFWEKRATSRHFLSLP
jgi:hypothetical protein